MAGSFGYELDLNLLTEEEKEQVRAQIKNYHRFEMLIRQGRYYRLTDVWQKKNMLRGSIAGRMEARRWLLW